MPEFSRFLHNLIDKEAGHVSPAETPAPKRERQGVVAPEKRAEELYAFWRDFGRLKMQSGKLERERKRKKQETPTEEETQLRERLEKVRQEIADRWHDKKTRKVFQQNIAKSFQERENIAPNYRNFTQLRKEKDQAIKRRDGFYQEIFSHRGTEADELTQIEMAETVAQIKQNESSMEQMEAASSELAARLSFERLQKYHNQLAHGFIWTPSREKYFDEILEHLVILDQNRPVLLSGETGTGKTRLARAVGERLTGQAPYEVGEEAKTDIRPLLGSQSLDKDGAYVVYGQLGQALTGKENTRQEKAGQGGLFYMDEMNGYPPDALRALIKQISGRRPGEEISFAAWRGKKEQITAEFGFLGSANLPSEKHPDRNPLPVEVARELSAIDVDYPPQTKDNPELYEMMIAALMDQNGRVRASKEELAPQWNPIVVDGKTRQYELNISTETGGTLWRFANFVAETQKSYKGQENVLTDEKTDASYLRQAVLDPGLVLSWLAEYRKSTLRQGMDLQSFLAKKIDNWREQKIYPEEDRQLLKSFQDKFNLAMPESPKHYAAAVLSPQEIGALSPRVPRQTETMLKPPEPEFSMAYTADGQAIEYKPASWQDFEPGNRLTPKGKKAPILTYLGLSKDNQVILEGADGVLAVATDVFEKKYEKEKTPEFVITVKDALNPYREALLEGGILPAQAMEKQETKLDLIQTLKQDRNSYQSAGLTEWAQSLNGLESRLQSLSLEKRKTIEQEIKDGAITIFMPGKDIQFNLTVERLVQQLKSLWIEDGQPQAVADTYLEWKHFKNLIQSQTKAAELLADVPTRPYILLTKPFQAPDARTCNKNVSGQLQELKLVNNERKAQKRDDAYPMNPHEYVATQKRFTERLPLQTSSLLSTISPLDKNTWTRFIHLPFADGNVPNGYWNPADRRLELGRGDAEGRYSSGGFRLSVRVEI